MINNIKLSDLNTVDWWLSMWKFNSGPNPFHECKLCGKTEPGLQEYLEAHSNRHLCTNLK